MRSNSRKVEIAGKLDNTSSQMGSGYFDDQLSSHRASLDGKKKKRLSPGPEVIDMAGYINNSMKRRSTGGKKI